MQTSKIKDVFILALILVNVFLLLLVIPQRQETARVYDETGATLGQLFAERGIELDWEKVPEYAELRSQASGQNQEQAVRSAALALLGENAQEETGYTSRKFQSGLGQAEFHKSGEFTVSLTGEQSAGTDLLKAAQETLTAMGYAHGQLELERVAAGKYVVSGRQYVAEAPVYSSWVELEYDNNSLKAITGQWYAGYEAQTTGTACISASTALVSFISSQVELGWVCTTIDTMTQGYVEEATPTFGGATLVPVWRIETDTGSFTVNGLTKEVSAGS